ICLCSKKIPGPPAEHPGPRPSSLLLPRHKATDKALELWRVRGRPGLACVLPAAATHTQGHVRPPGKGAGPEGRLQLTPLRKWTNWGQGSLAPLLISADEAKLGTGGSWRWSCPAAVPRVMATALKKPRTRPAGQSVLQAEERREPLKSKSNEELPGDPKVTRKKKVGGAHEQEALPEKMGAVSLRTPAASPLQRAVPISESLLEELSQALLRLDMGLEQEYAYDIFSSLVQKQACYTFRASDLSQAVTAKKHALVVDWLMQVNECVGLDESPLHLAVYLLNSCLRASRVRVRAPQLRLLSAACLFLACKVEESIILPAAELCDVANDKFTPEELLRMERKILSCLKFKLHYANPVPLLCLLAEVGRCTLEVQHLAMYFLELSLLEVDCLCFEPAQLALAALCLAQRVLRGAGSGGQEASPRLLTYSEAELAAVHPFMARAALRGDDSALGATFRKYSKPRKLGVSSNPAVLASEYLQRCLGSPTP
ncbi:hypothetical protein lerEdw1_009946, partial [Lerista edwardsae]